MGSWLSKPIEDKDVYNELDSEIAKKLIEVVQFGPQTNYSVALETECIRRLSIREETIAPDQFKTELKDAEKLAVGHFSGWMSEKDVNKIKADLSYAIGGGSGYQHFTDGEGMQFKIWYFAVKRVGNLVYFSSILHTFTTKKFDEQQLLNSLQLSEDDVNVKAILAIRTLRKFYCSKPAAFTFPIEDNLMQMVKLSK